MSERKLVFVVILLVQLEICLSLYTKPWTEKYESNNKCPKLYPKNFDNYMPAGNLTAGNYTEKTDLKGLKQCVMSCCLADNCNIVFIVDSRCYHIECVTDELCLPLPRSGRNWNRHVSMILVKPVLPSENWSEILGQSSFREEQNFGEEELVYGYPNRHSEVADDEESNYLAHFINNLPTIDDEDSGYEKYDNSDNDMMLASKFLEHVVCVMGTNNCPFNAECIPLGHNMHKGICKCVLGTEMNEQGACVPLRRPYSKGPTDLNDSIKKEDIETKSDIKENKPVQNLTVSILSQTVQLPENEVTLSAYTIPDEKSTMSHYSHVWTLVGQPKDTFTGNMIQNGASVTLTDLTEGQYRFKVTVNGTNAYGEGYANVTVLPPKRINKAPVVVITPQSQTVKLPNSGAVLDGSESKDDDQIISWHWELTAGPLGYQPKLEDGATLVLKDLKQPGNYTFKLTVEDSDHVKNFTSANITVLNHIDYPPEANAGQDVILYLPNNNLTLNGSLSTDDHEITSWEWTKSAEDANKAVDMQNTHSPYLQLSNLSEGVYTFVLKVTDSSSQSSSAEVHVFVKPPTNTPPVADAGVDSDDDQIISWHWELTAGPLGYQPKLEDGATLVLKDLKQPGNYTFKLTVEDSDHVKNFTSANITVLNHIDYPPEANAGQDVILYLPNNNLTLNGSLSTDDHEITSWEWTKSAEDANKAVDMQNTHSPYLQLSNLSEGVYTFVLKVTDSSSQSSSAEVHVFVKPPTNTPPVADAGEDSTKTAHQRQTRAVTRF
ncbi:dyslexia-associated protein KIAA0319-like protein isoform X4 [Pieris napi]|uniref:dyslexia-associated protein KIAA0319-like protein isoform X4 n=1 Tax=Pieris napi TaxID=78633 RepID=UPI001FB938A7|nr:dyslexia-associated protein KIAA0319-like protein isoform X4 [Pieris napi]